MGFDVIGAKPKNETGEYFGNSVWRWHPLWGFIANRCQDILSEEEIRAGSFNDGLLISAEKALAIGLRLKFLIDQKEVKKFEEEYKQALEALPDETCQFCRGTGRRDDEHVRGECNGCRGRGKTRPWACHYPFSEENVLEFANFAIESGGFRIC